MRVIKRLIMILLAMVFVGLLAASVWYSRYVSNYNRAAASLPKEIQAAKQEGLPLTPADLAPATPVAPEKNSAALYVQMKPRRMSRSEYASLMAYLSGTATEQDCQVPRRLVNRAAPLMRLAERAARRPDCDFHRNWNLGEGLAFPEYTPMREMAQLLAARALLESETGQTEAALHTIRVGARMAQSVGKEPLLLALGTRFAIEATLDRSFHRILRRYADRADILPVALKTERAFGDRPDLRHALDGEVVLRRIMIGMVRSNPTYIASDAGGMPIGIQRSVVADAYEAHSLSYWRRIYAAMAGAHNDPMAACRALKAVEEAEEATETTRDSNRIASYEFGAVLCPAMSGLAQRVAMNEAQRRLRRTTIGLIGYRQHHGQFPTTFAMLTESMEPDPYTGQPWKSRSRQSRCTSPEARNPVRIHNSINTNYGYTVHQALSSKETVEWITMVKRHRSNTRDVRAVNGQSKNRIDE